MTTEDVKALPLDPGPLVLIVDDELTPRSITARMVRSLGYRARSCQSGLATLRFLKAHPGEARLLLADLGMPRMDGGELAERAKDRDPSLIAVLMADPRDPHVRQLLSGYRDLPFVPKPVSFNDLAEKLERLLGIPAQPTSPPRSGGSGRSNGSSNGQAPFYLGCSLCGAAGGISSAPRSVWTSRVLWPSVWSTRTPGTIWRKIRNPAYTQMAGRRDLFHPT